MIGSARKRDIIGISVAMTVCMLALPGCIAHGDCVRFCEFRATLVAAATTAPLAETLVHLSTAPASQNRRARPYHATTDQNGAFAIRTTIGGGYVTWLLFIPIVRENSLRVPESVHLEMEEANRFAGLDVPLTRETRQRIKKGQTEIDLGELGITWQPKGLQTINIDASDN